MSRHRDSRSPKDAGAKREANNWAESGARSTEGSKEFIMGTVDKEEQRPGTRGLEAIKM